MPNFARLAALAAFAALSACAPVKLATLQVASYDPAANVELSADQAKVLESLKAAVAERKLATQVVADGSAINAARMLVNLRADQRGILPSEGRDLLHQAGIAELGARWEASPVGYNDRVPGAKDVGTLVDALGAVGSTVYVGVADLPDPSRNRRIWATVAVPRVVALTGVPMKAEPGAKLSLAGRVLDAATDLKLELLKPDGTVDRSDLKPGSDNSFTASLDVPSAAGAYVVGVTARFKGAARQLLAAPMFVGAEPAPWPVRAADLDVKDEKGLEQVLPRVLGDVRKKAFGESKELVDSARACANALAEEKECAVSASMVAWDVFPSALERMVSEIAAAPATRALWSSDGLGVAAAKSKSGGFVVVTAFGAATSTPAPAVAPADPAADPAPAPAPAPAATPASAP